LASILFSGAALNWLVWAFVSQHIWITASIMITLAAAFAVVAREHWVRWHAVLVAQMLRDRFDPSRAPTPAHPATRQRLEEIAKRRDGNAVVFSGNEAFVGSGERLAREQVVIDVSRGKKERDGTIRKPTPFTNGDLHKAFKRTIRDLGLKDLIVADRVFVNGRHVQANEELQRDSLEPPRSMVSDDLIARVTEHPAPDARTYVCAEIRRWQGQLTVTLFVRAVRAGKSLYVEWSFYVLPPLTDDYKGIDRLYAPGILRAAWGTARWGVRRVIPDLLASPFGLTRDLWRRMKWEASRTRQAYQIKHGRVFNYGALRSIREEAANGRSQRHYFLGRDELMYVLLLQESLIRGIRAFLKEHNIALAGFEGQVTTIINASYSNHSMHVGGNISGSNISVGNEASSGWGTKPSPNQEGNHG
jgi:hypothetical protein